MTRWRIFPLGPKQWLAVLWTTGLYGYVAFSCLLAHQMNLRSHASLALTKQYYGQLQPLLAKTEEIWQQIGWLPDEQYQNGTPAKHEQDRLLKELTPITTQAIRLQKEENAAIQDLESPFWGTAQMVFNRTVWWLMPFLFGGWILFAVPRKPRV